MADDDELPQYATARPPAGEEDVYSASTVAGAASDEILAIIRGESQRSIPGAPGVPKDLEVKAASQPKVEVKTPLAVPLTALTPTSEPPKTVEVAPDPEPAPAPAPEPAAIMPAPNHDEVPRQNSALHPAVGIVLFFVAVVAVLAALIR